MMLIDCFYILQVRQFMTGIKNYLVKHGEGELEDLIERERSQVRAVIRAVIHSSRYSQTCVKQPHKGSTKSSCFRQVAAYQR